MNEILFPLVSGKNVLLIGTYGAMIRMEEHGKFCYDSRNEEENWANGDDDPKEWKVVTGHATLTKGSLLWPYYTSVFGDVIVYLAVIVQA